MGEDTMSPAAPGGEIRRLDRLMPRITWVGGAATVVGGLGALVMALVSEHGVDRLLSTYLVSFAFFLSLALGALFFVMLQHVTRAGWSVVVRRISEGMASTVMAMGVLVLPVLVGIHRLYPWSLPDEARDPLLAGKAGFLNPGFFVARIALYFVIWSALARFFLRTSTAQDESGDPALTRRMERWSAPGLVVFALSLNFAAFDILMSLDPHWFSTIFGVYYFASAVVGFCAVMPLILVVLQRGGLLRLSVSIEHYHDLGKLLFAFIVFWAYIAFSQYMLIWYGNIPEETEWYLKRQSGEWLWLSLVLLFGHFVLPFVILVSRFAKRRPILLAIAGVWVLAMHWLDMCWLVMPETSPGGLRLGVMDLLCLVGMGGLFVLAWVRALRGVSLLPERDPRLAESLAFENA
jgi:hypothetical protein